MAAGNFERSLAVTLKHEGGFSDNPKDPGNWTGGAVGKGVLKGTKYGIAAASYPTLDIRNLTRDQAAAIYRRVYWSGIGADLLPAGVDLSGFDAAVNSGQARARRWYEGARDAGDAAAVVKRLCALRRSFLQGLSTFKTFGKGWMRRVAEIEATGVSWALAAAGRAPADIARDLRAESDKAEGQAKRQDQVGTGATTAGIGNTVASTQFDLDPWLAAGVIVLALGLLVVVIIAVRNARQHRERADAFHLAALKVAHGQRTA